MRENRRHNIVIVGGGAAGLALASKLARKRSLKSQLQVTLVDHEFTHVWKPLLHEVAAGSFDPNVNELSYLAQAKRCGFRFKLGVLAGIDREAKRIVLEPVEGDGGVPIANERSISYDTLVLAIGSVSNDFGVEGVSEHCLYLDSVEEATAFHKRLVQTYTKIFAADGRASSNSVSVTIVGAGATGVELAAQLRQITDLLDSYVDITGQRITISVKIVEGADRVLPGLPEYLSEATAAQLNKLGIDLLTGEQVSRVTATHVETKSGKHLDSDLTVWAAGIKAPPVLAESGFDMNRIHQLVVNESLQTEQDPSVFAIGDCASCQWTENRQVPPRAQSAHQQAKLLAKALPRHINGESLPVFKYRDYGSLVSLGDYSTVGNLMGNVIKSVRIEGLIARMVYLSLYKMHQISLYGYIRTGLFTLSNLFRRSIHPEIKLH